MRYRQFESESLLIKPLDVFVLRIDVAICISEVVQAVSDRGRVGWVKLATEIEGLFVDTGGVLVPPEPEQIGAVVVERKRKLRILRSGSHAQQFDGFLE